MLSTFSVLPSPKVRDRLMSYHHLLMTRIQVSETIVEVCIWWLPALNCRTEFPQPYNAMLSLHQLVENGDLTICLDNEALCVDLLHQHGGRTDDAFYATSGMISLPALSRSRVRDSRI